MVAVEPDMLCLSLLFLNFAVSSSSMSPHHRGHVFYGSHVLDLKVAVVISVLTGTIIWVSASLLASRAASENLRRMLTFATWTFLALSFHGRVEGEH